VRRFAQAGLGILLLAGLASCSPKTDSSWTGPVDSGEPGGRTARFAAIGVKGSPKACVFTVQDPAKGSGTKLVWEITSKDGKSHLLLNGKEILPPREGFLLIVNGAGGDPVEVQVSEAEASRVFQADVHPKTKDLLEFWDKVVAPRIPKSG